MFEVPADADAAFLAGWRRAREPGTTTLHRALRSDVGLRFVEVGAGEPAPIDLGFPAHRSRYAVVREDGEPEGSGGVVLIDPQSLTPDEDEPFLVRWERRHAAFAAQRGYLGTRLYGSAGPAGFRFVEIARWSSPLMVARALREPGIGTSPAGRAALYLPV